MYKKKKPNFRTLVRAAAFHTEWSPERKEEAHVSSGPAPSGPQPPLGPSVASRKKKGVRAVGVSFQVCSAGASQPLAAHLLSSQLGAAAAALGCLFPMVQNWFDFCRAAQRLYMRTRAPPLVGDETRGGTRVRENFKPHPLKHNQISSLTALYFCLPLLVINKN